MVFADMRCTVAQEVPSLKENPVACHVNVTHSPSNIRPWDSTRRLQCTLHRRRLHYVSQERNVPTWQRGVMAVKESRDYMFAAWIFMQHTKQDSLAPGQDGGLAYIKQWCKFYATNGAFSISEERFEAVRVCLQALGVTANSHVGCQKQDFVMLELEIHSVFRVLCDAP